MPDRPLPKLGTRPAPKAAQDSGPSRARHLATVVATALGKDRSALLPEDLDAYFADDRSGFDREAVDLLKARLERRTLAARQARNDLMPHRVAKEPALLSASLWVEQSELLEAEARTTSAVARALEHPSWTTALNLDPQLQERLRSQLHVVRSSVAELARAARLGAADALRQQPRGTPVVTLSETMRRVAGDLEAASHLARTSSEPGSFRDMTQVLLTFLDLAEEGTPLYFPWEQVPGSALAFSCAGSVVAGVLSSVVKSLETCLGKLPKAADLAELNSAVAPGGELLRSIERLSDRVSTDRKGDDPVTQEDQDAMFKALAAGRALAQALDRFTDGELPAAVPAWTAHRAS